MGRKKPLFDEILVVDIEATCWDDEVSKRPPGAQGEIIEVGLALLNIQTGEITRAPLMMVKPEENPVSEFCTQLTTWTQDDVDSGLPLSDICKSLRSDFFSKRRPWASWGNYDRRQFERECERKKIPYPFGPSHLNVKDLFTLKNKLTCQVDMGTALKIIDLNLEGTWHVGRDDAYNIARILRELLD